MRRRLCVLVAVALSGSVLLAQSPKGHDVLWQIRREAVEQSQVLATLHMLTDRYGPRLTGSPNHKAAAEWAAAQLTRWGLSNAHLEPWNFDHEGWLNERLTAHIVAPVKDALVAEALAWTPGTPGTVRGPATLVTLPPRPSRDELTKYLESVKAQVAAHVVLVGEPHQVGVSFAPPAKRLDDGELRARFDPVAPSAFGPPQIGPPPGGPAPNRLTPAQVDQIVDEFLVANHALARFNDAGRDHGQIRAFNNRTFDVAKAVPTLVVRNEDYGRIARLLRDGPVELELDVVNRTYPEGRTSYNVVAELPGSDLASEVVMLGGHLDSWHAATGATDNAIGVSVMMDAIRVLEAVGARPRRTIRIALWGGEEQGLLGSAAYVKEHFGSVEEPKPEFAKFAGYLNIDSGTGRARGATVFGPALASAIVRQIFEPLEDLGVVGASSTSSRRRGGSDHTSFNEAGLPGIGFAQDPIEYQSDTWHTNLDTFERIIPEDAMKSTAIIAWTAYQLASRGEMLPRFSKDEMPKAPQPPPTSSGGGGH